MSFISVQGHRLEYLFIRTVSDMPTIIFLHEGLGSVAMWKDFPRQVSQVTGCNVLAYSRYGYGQSDPLAAPRNLSFIHDEALNILPELLYKLSVARPVLLGHSDGGSIALLHAAAARERPEGVIVLAPHVMVEEATLASIAAARQAYETTDLREKLSRYHADPDSAFWGWNNIWLHPEFRHWNIEEYLPAITCPVLAIQGEQDEYGTMVQVDRIKALVRDVEVLKLPACRHSPHRDQPVAVIDAVKQFIETRLSQRPTE